MHAFIGTNELFDWSLLNVKIIWCNFPIYIRNPKDLMIRIFFLAFRDRNMPQKTTTS